MDLKETPTSSPDKNFDQSRRNFLKTGLSAGLLFLTDCAPFKSSIQNLLTFEDNPEWDKLTEAEKKLALNPPAEPSKEEIARNMSLSKRLPETEGLFDELIMINDPEEYYRALIKTLHSKGITIEDTPYKGCKFQISDLTFYVDYPPEDKIIEITVMHESPVAIHLIVGKGNQTILPAHHKEPYSKTTIMDENGTYSVNRSHSSKNFPSYSVETYDPANHITNTLSFYDKNGDGIFDKAFIIQYIPEDQNQPMLKYIKNPHSGNYRFEKKGF